MAVIWGPQTFTADGTGNQGVSNRGVATGLSGSGNQVRVTFGLFSGSQRFTVDHCAIGILSGATAPNMAATDFVGRTQPVELTFSGAHGFDIGFGGSGATSILSDWANLTFASTDTLIVVFDHNVTNGGAHGKTAAGTNWFKLATASWNTATVSTFTSEAIYRGISQIEGQTIATPYEPWRQRGPILAQ